MFLRMMHPRYDGDTWLSDTFRAPTLSLLSHLDIQFVDLERRSIPATGFQSLA